MSQKNNIKIKKVLVVGLGLIGASLCRDLKKNSNYEKIYGHDTDAVAMEYALNNNYVHETRKDLEEGIKDSDLIVLCIPVHAIRKVLNVVKYFFNGDKVITETLSSKGSIFEYLTDNKLLDTKNFILSHPMAGTENFGIRNSEENLFQEANTFICPLKFSDPDKCNEVKALWKSVGSNTNNIIIENHDLLLTYLSHGPHAISFALSNITPLFEDLPWVNTKGSLAEMIRVAKSNPEAWANIFQDNQDNLINYINIYLSELELLKSILESKKQEDLLSYLKKSKPKNTKFS